VPENKVLRSYSDVMTAEMSLEGRAHMTRNVFIYADYSVFLGL
jgi:hypothetical protein